MEARPSIPAATPGRLAASAMRERGARALWLLLLAGSVTLYILVLAEALQRHQDFDTYLQSAQDIWQRRPLYAAFLEHPFPDPTLRPAFIYPPVFALTLAPLALVPRPAAIWIWLTAMQAALALSTVLVLRRASIPALMAAAVGTLTFYPLWVDAIQGQANLLLLVLIVLGLLAVTAGDARGGLWLGLAAALKLTPALLMAWLLWERRFRSAAWMAAGFVLASAAGAAVRPADTVAFFGEVAPALARGTAYYSNQSLHGLLARLFSDNAYTEPLVRLSWEPALVIGAMILTAAWWVWRSRGQQDDLSRALTFLPLLPLLSPVTWEHHLVILLPLLWFSIVQVARRGWPVVSTTMVGLMMFSLSVLPRLHFGPAFGSRGFAAAQTTDPLVLLTANSLLCGTLMFFLIGPWLLRLR